MLIEKGGGRVKNVHVYVIMEKITLYFDQTKGELYFHGMNSEMGNRHFDAFAQREIEKILGPTTKTILYRAYKTSSLRRFNVLYQEISRKHKKISKKSMLLKIFDVLPKLGYGLFELSNFDESRMEFTVMVKNCFNADGFEEEKQKKAICYQMGARLAAIFELVFEMRMGCVEKKCRAMGADTCEFEIKAGRDRKTIEERAKLPSTPNAEEMKKFHIEFDENSGEIFFDKSRSLIRGREDVSVMQREVEKIIGAPVKTLLYNINKSEAMHTLSTGRRKFLISFVGLFSKRMLIYLLSHEIYKRGYGVPEILSIDTRRARVKIRIKNCYNAMGYENSEKPICYQMGGLLAGAVQTIFGKEMDVLETKCGGMGHSCCEFEIMPKR